MKSYIYICNNFTGNKVHSEVILKLSRKYSNINHYIFVPCSNRGLIGRNNISKNNIIVEYFYVNKYMKFFPIIKSLIIIFMIISKIKFYKIDMKESKALSYTFWSDGVLCLYLYFIFGTVFSTFVRTTDVSIFFKYGYHLRLFFRLIASKSKYIYFPSLVLMKNGEKTLFLEKNSNKFKFIPNPINDYWVDNIYYFDNLSINNKKILFVGSFDLNKNIMAVFNSCSALYNLRGDFQLEFIGGSVTDFKKICQINSIPDWVSVLDKIPKEELLLKYRSSNILLVPSFLETFGMVYIEAISQGCIAICSKNQGIDGLFSNENILYTVDPCDCISISEALNNLLDKDIKISDFELKKLLLPFISENVINDYSSFYCEDS
ncbi:glycosyltransferase family 4 protein [Acinetobacter sp. WCHAc010052]|uniref:glycosyltransferase family 4 protein n=1 Tax=Acinetobacter sp. WCHAc010052 TaxID=2004647 RepID=UPI000B3BF35F|nr:glycosyltransferase [Acinetobacter sp. WCHAc010052]AXY61541.1 glycosyltransferase family 1 protein [Acinetobacter sp. WCHAc010052]